MKISQVLTLFIYFTIIFSLFSSIYLKSSKKLKSHKLERGKYKKTLRVFKSHKSSAHKLHKRYHSKDGSGTWDDGYTCPGLSITQITSTQKDQATALSNKEEVFFEPRWIMNAIGKGVFFKFTKSEPSAFLQKILVKDTESDKWVLPYRLMTTDLEFVREGLKSLRVVQAYFTNDEGENFFLKLYLPTPMVGHIISTEQCNSLVKWINIRRKESQSHISEAKKILSALSVEIIESKSLLDKLTKQVTSKAEIKKETEQEKKDVEDKKAAIQKNLDEARKKLEELQIQINDLRNTHDKLTTEFEEYENKLSYLKNVEAEQENFLNNIEKAKVDLYFKIEEKNNLFKEKANLLYKLSLNNKNIKDLISGINDPSIIDSKVVSQKLNSIYPIK
jgi:hypothetical protein